MGLGHGSCREKREKMVNGRKWERCGLVYYPN